jgi:hypothetical protein
VYDAERDSDRHRMYWGKYSVGCGRPEQKVDEKGRRRL